MTKGKLIELFADYNIPNDAVLMSDSGWECSETEMDGVYYSSAKNIVMFTQKFSEYETYYTEEHGYIELKQAESEDKE